MLSPATFIGVAKATSPTGAPPSARSANIQPVRVPGALPAAVPMVPPQQKSMAAPSPTATPASPPRNLPRGSLLDLSV